MAMCRNETGSSVGASEAVVVRKRSVFGRNAAHDYAVRLARIRTGARPCSWTNLLRFPYDFVRRSRLDGCVSVRHLQPRRRKGAALPRSGRVSPFGSCDAGLAHFFAYSAERAAQVRVDRRVVFEGWIEDRFHCGCSVKKDAHPANARAESSSQAREVHRGGAFAFGRKRTRFHQRDDAGGALARIVTALRRETPLELLH